MICYTLFDKKSRQPVSIFSAASDEMAIRSFMDLITDPSDSVFTLHFDDFSLFKIGDLVGDGSNPLFDHSPAEVLDGSTLQREVILSKRLERQEFLKKRFEVLGDNKNA